jgi:hypothetical protein
MSEYFGYVVIRKKTLTFKNNSGEEDTLIKYQMDKDGTVKLNHKLKKLWTMLRPPLEYISHPDNFPPVHPRYPATKLIGTKSLGGFIKWTRINQQNCETFSVLNDGIHLRMFGNEMINIYDLKISYKIKYKKSLNKNPAKNMVITFYTSHDNNIANVQVDKNHRLTRYDVTLDKKNTCKNCFTIANTKNLLVCFPYNGYRLNLKITAIVSNEDKTLSKIDNMIKIKTKIGNFILPVYNVEKTNKGTYLKSATKYFYDIPEQICNTFRILEKKIPITNDSSDNMSNNEIVKYQLTIDKLIPAYMISTLGNDLWALVKYGSVTLTEETNSFSTQLPADKAIGDYRACNNQNCGWTICPVVCDNKVILPCYSSKLAIKYTELKISLNFSYDSTSESQYGTWCSGMYIEAFLHLSHYKSGWTDLTSISLGKITKPIQQFTCTFPFDDISYNGESIGFVLTGNFNNGSNIYSFMPDFWSCSLDFKYVVQQ